LSINRGALGALLAGLEVVTGEIVVMLDGDDLMSKDRLEIIYDLMNNHPEVDVILHDYEWIDSSGEKILPNSTSMNRARLGSQLRMDPRVRLDFGPGAYMSFRFHLEDVKKINQLVSGVELPKLLYQDSVLGYWLAVNRPCFLWTPSVLYLRRVHTTNSGSSTDIYSLKKSVQRGLETLKLCCEILQGDDGMFERSKKVFFRYQRQMYIFELYRGKLWNASKRLLWLFNNSCTGKSIVFSEIIRFIVVSTFGMRVFFWLKTSHVLKFFRFSRLR